MPKKLTKEQFTQKATELHNGKYNYNKVYYINNNTKVVINCPIHSDFEQTPNSHLNGNGCKKCYHNRAGSYLKSDTDTFIQKAKNIHGDKFDYSKVNYINNSTNVDIICPYHGLFQQTPATHLRGSGCNSCNNEYLRNKYRHDKEDFIIRANNIHRNKYDYSKVSYINSHTKVTIICEDHGEFQQKPIKHLTGQGCPTCKSSRGELLICTILNKHKIKYIQEYSILGATPRFRYDFYLPEYNILIEFHGCQHYKVIDFFGGEEGLRQTKFRDLLKKELASLAKMPLICFNYKHLKMNSTEDFELLLLARLAKIVKGKINEPFT